jgi:hypothetical protein
MPPRFYIKDNFRCVGKRNPFGMIHFWDNFDKFLCGFQAFGMSRLAKSLLENRCFYETILENQFYNLKRLQKCFNQNQA